MELWYDNEMTLYQHACPPPYTHSHGNVFRVSFCLLSEQEALTLIPKTMAFEIRRHFYYFWSTFYKSISQKFYIK